VTHVKLPKGTHSFLQQCTLGVIVFFWNCFGGQTFAAGSLKVWDKPRPPPALPPFAQVDALAASPPPSTFRLPSSLHTRTSLLPLRTLRFPEPSSRPAGAMFWCLQLFLGLLLLHLTAAHGMFSPIKISGLKKSGRQGGMWNSNRQKKKHVECVLLGSRWREGELLIGGWQVTLDPVMLCV